MDGDTARIALSGELTDAARRPLVRVLADAAAAAEALARVVLDVRGVTFMNSAGMAVLVQLQRWSPRGHRSRAARPAGGVRRPLQLSGLWRRFPVLDSSDDGGVAPAPERGAS